MVSFAAANYSNCNYMSFCCKHIVLPEALSKHSRKLDHSGIPEKERECASLHKSS